MSADCGDSATGSSLAGRLVGDVMRAEPKTLPDSSSVADVRAFFENPHVLTALLVDEGGRFVGAIERGGLPPGIGPDEPAREYADRSPATAGAAAPALETMEWMNANGVRRLVVVEEETGLLGGLLCLTSSGDSFCS